MVLSFRMSELHVLLEFAGRNKSGRKQDLTKRALELVQKGCSLPVQSKIRDLYSKQIYPMTKGGSLPHKELNMPVMHRHPGMVGYPPDGPVVPRNPNSPELEQLGIRTKKFKQLLPWDSNAALESQRPARSRTVRYTPESPGNFIPLSNSNCISKKWNCEIEIKLNT
ncbi:E3 SUMO-protein ligase pias2 [Bulinus truncatus]|nr:E3 SUMO-protein ligase pias2 [Bulinus truncatus]